MWYKEIGLYVAFNLTADELTAQGLLDLCPTRDGVPGPHPTMSSMRKPKETDRYEHWTNPLREPTNAERRKMIIEAVRICLTYILANHYYTFDNKIYKQQRGGPIGLDLTGTVAQIFMIWWDGEFMKRLTDLGIILHMLKRYVDDKNLVANALPPGTRYVNGRLILEDPADMTAADERTMKVIQNIGNDIHPSIQLEIDYPSRNTDCKMPVLDLKLWLEERAGSSTIMHEHYDEEGL